MLQVGDDFHLKLFFNQQQINQFAQLTGDHNPLHTDADFAATTIFKRPIMHGMFGAAVFSRIFGADFPGSGTIYLSQSVEFKRPMYVETHYEAVVRLVEHDAERHRGHFLTEITDVETGKVVMTGAATLQHPEKL